MAGILGMGAGVVEGTEAERSVSIPQDEAWVWGPRMRGHKDRGAGGGRALGLGHSCGHKRIPNPASGVRFLVGGLGSG